MGDREIRLELLSRGQARLNAPREKPIRFTGLEPADILLNDLEKHPHAFLLANVLNRQMNAEAAFSIPYYISQKLGGFAFSTLAALDLDEFRVLMIQPEPLHRFPGTMANNLFQALKLIGSVYDGDASGIWNGEPDSATVVYRFLGFRGVGPKIATLAANTLACDFKVRFSDHISIDVSVDVHVRRVFERLGLVPAGASVEQILYRARSLNPEYPGLLDFPAWEIGRTWCHPQHPECTACYVRMVCPSSGASD